MPLLQRAADNTVYPRAPTIEGAKVEGKVLAQVKGEKITVYKYQSKKDSKRKIGHRQPYTKVEITAVKA